ncbi:unnamed protein product, partial [Ectocarpus sp. 13 AM-2016]
YFARVLVFPLLLGHAMDIEVISVDGQSDESNLEEGELDDEEIFSQEEPVQGEQDAEIPPQQQGQQHDLATDTIDLTAAGCEAAISHFEQEYNDLHRSAQGFGFPFEAVAELLLRHPEHWWCR